MIRTILGYAVIALGVLILLFFRNYNGHIIPYPSLVYSCGLVMIVAGGWMLGAGGRKKHRDLGKRITDIKKTGKAIKVDLSKCTIKSNTYAEEQALYKDSSYQNDIEFWNAIGGDEMKNVKNIEVKQSVITYTHEGKTYHSNIIAKDKITLTFLLDNKKETYIYLDPQTKEYYFDLDFLFHEE